MSQFSTLGFLHILTITRTIRFPVYIAFDCIFLQKCSLYLTYTACLFYVRAQYSFSISSLYLASHFCGYRTNVQRLAKLFQIYSLHNPAGNHYVLCNHLLQKPWIYTWCFQTGKWMFFIAFDMRSVHNSETRLHNYALTPRGHCFNLRVTSAIQFNRSILYIL